MKIASLMKILIDPSLLKAKRRKRLTPAYTTHNVYVQVWKSYRRCGSRFSCEPQSRGESFGSQTWQTLTPLLPSLPGPSAIYKLPWILLLDEWWSTTTVFVVTAGFDEVYRSIHQISKWWETHEFLPKHFPGSHQFGMAHFLLRRTYIYSPFIQKKRMI